MAHSLEQATMTAKQLVGEYTASTSYVKWNDPAVEPVVPGEKEKVDKVVQLINGVQTQNYSEHHHGLRGTHVKTQSVVKGSLTVKSDLPEHLSQGIFAESGKRYPVGIRFANEPSKLQDDRAPGPRGLGIRVFDVTGPGPFLDAAGERTHTQDFTFNNAPILELRDVGTTGEIFDTRLRNWSNPEGLEKELEQRDDTTLQKAPMQLPNRHFLSYTYYSQSAYRFGDYVVKHALFPSTQLQTQLASQKITDASDPQQHSQWLQQFFAEHDAAFDFRVQLARDVTQQPVEDASVQWSEIQAPWETVATIVIPKGQNPLETKRTKFWEDQVKLNVWYGLAAHQPLGSVNRLRKRVYQESAKKREELNGVELLDIGSIDQIP